MNKKARLLAAALLVASAPLFAACTNGVAAGNDAQAHSHDLTISDGWAKSASSGAMTGVFGVLENHTDTDIVIDRVESDVAGLVELHEVTAEGIMQEIAGDVTVAAGGIRELAPGADHIMLMQLHEDLLAGDEVTFAVHYTVAGSESSNTFTVLVKDYAGANEDYGGAHGEHAHDHSDQADHAHDHDSHSEAADEHGSH